MAIHNFLLVVFITFCCPVLATSDRFQHWYPEYQHIFTKILRENCSEPYAFYRAGKWNATRFENIDIWEGAGKSSQLVYPAASCVLKASSEWMKANMAAAAVLLGLTPTLLTALGPSAEDVSALFVLAHRPLIGFFIAFGSPTLCTLRDIDYDKEIESYRVPSPRTPKPRYGQYIVMIFEFLLLLYAVASNIVNSYWLGIQTSCVFAPQLWYLPIVWLSLGLLIHVSASWALWSRITYQRPYSNLLDWLKIQFAPISEQKPLKILSRRGSVHWKVHSDVAKCFVAIGGTVHLIFGTLVFSSLTFITVKDATVVITRYMVSLLICRAICEYELTALRENYTQVPETNGCAESLSLVETDTDRS